MMLSSHQSSTRTCHTTLSPLPSPQGPVKGTSHLDGVVHQQPTLSLAWVDGAAAVELQCLHQSEGEGWERGDSVELAHLVLYETTEAPVSVHRAEAVVELLLQDELMKLVISSF